MLQLNEPAVQVHAALARNVAMHKFDVVRGAIDLQLPPHDLRCVREARVLLKGVYLPEKPPVVLPNWIAGCRHASEGCVARSALSAVVLLRRLVLAYHPIKPVTSGCQSNERRQGHSRGDEVFSVSSSKPPLYPLGPSLFSLPFS